jgi:hypothetical protein
MCLVPSVAARKHLLQRGLSQIHVMDAGDLYDGKVFKEEVATDLADEVQEWRKSPKSRGASANAADEWDWKSGFKPCSKKGTKKGSKKSGSQYSCDEGTEDGGYGPPGSKEPGPDDEGNGSLPGEGGDGSYPGAGGDGSYPGEGGDGSNPGEGGGGPGEGGDGSNPGEGGDGSNPGEGGDGSNPGAGAGGDGSNPGAGGDGSNPDEGVVDRFRCPQRLQHLR